MSNIEVIRGNTRVLNLNFTEDGSAIDITGYTVWFTVREKVAKTSVTTDTDAVIAKKQLPAELTDPTNGKTVITLSSTDTDIEPNNYIYDVQLKSDGGSIYSTSRGVFTVSGDVTRSR
jgi:hypothetical protein